MVDLLRPLEPLTVVLCKIRQFVTRDRFHNDHSTPVCLFILTVICDNWVGSCYRIPQGRTDLCRIVLWFGSCQPLFGNSFRHKSLHAWMLFFQFEAFTPKPFCEFLRPCFISDPWVALGIMRRQPPVTNHSFVIEIKHLQDFMKPKQSVRLRNRAPMQFFGDFCI